MKVIYDILSSKETNTMITLRTTVKEGLPCIVRVMRYVKEASYGNYYELANTEIRIASSLVSQADKPESYA